MNQWTRTFQLAFFEGMILSSAKRIPFPALMGSKSMRSWPGIEIASYQTATFFVPSFSKSVVTCLKVVFLYQIFAYFFCMAAIKSSPVLIFAALAAGASRNIPHRINSPCLASLMMFSCFSFGSWFFWVWLAEMLGPKGQDSIATLGVNLHLACPLIARRLVLNCRHSPKLQRLILSGVEDDYEGCWN